MISRCVKFIFYSVHMLLLSDMTGHVHELLQDSHMFSDLTVYRGENMLSHSFICLLPLFQIQMSKTK